LFSAKQIADFITLLRALLGFSLVWIGLTEGADGLQKAVLIMIVGWTGDTIDGKIARRSKQSYNTWLGDHDLEIDMVVSCGLLVFLITAGYVAVWVASLYVLFWFFVFWRWRNIKVLGMLSQAPIYAWFLLVALLSLPNVGIWILVWMVVAIILTWPQFPQQVVPGFLDGFREFLINRNNIEEDR
jgi:phosphatidylglycerophosphate synthase